LFSAEYALHHSLPFYAGGLGFLAGDQLVVRVPFFDPPIYVAVWKIAVGRISLYLMDTDIEINAPWNRKISCHLYIGGLEQRLRQELILGIGEAEVLYILGMDHDSFMKLGMHPTQPAAGFNVTILALRLTDFPNGVSRRHAPRFSTRRMVKEYRVKFYRKALENVS